ncbi:Ribulose-phosphate 3-epimerase, cytoplasmic isoform [Hordeum vulgare]|nr:Ribulose-phosphate 3-epimerase, cytoplasmic isoform [Hordeum vulgare]
MLSLDFANLASEAKRMIRLDADWIHMDVMSVCTVRFTLVPVCLLVCARSILQAYQMGELVSDFRCGCDTC